MTNPIEIIVSPKSLERQIKILDERLAELQAEVSALEKKRDACYVLLGIPAGTVPVAAEPVVVKKAAPKKKRELETEELDEETVSLDADAVIPAEATEAESTHAAH